MSRSGYSDDCDNLGLYRASVARATRGKRGQAFLSDLKAALEAMPERRLISGDLERDGEVCALGSIVVARGVDLGTLDLDDAEMVARTFNIAVSLAREVVYENDEGVYCETREQRWRRMHAWVSRRINEDTDG